MKTQVYIGVDQTGAVNKVGTPKPLASCLIRNRTVEFFYLESFSKAQIDLQLKSSSTESVVVCLDCVIGLPRALKVTWREALKQIQPSSGFGRAVASQFFSTLGNGQVLRREIEVACKANSVFLERPFQKNIQCGTFRIWKDIAKSEHDFHAPHLLEEPSANSLPIFEGYPSLSWKILFGTSSRQPQRLRALVNRNFPELSFGVSQQRAVDGDPNLADAFVLAVTLKQFLGASQTCGCKDEGWILGHTPSIKRIDSRFYHCGSHIWPITYS